MYYEIMMARCYRNRKYQHTRRLQPVVSSCDVSAEMSHLLGPADWLYTPTFAILTYLFTFSQPIDHRRPLGSIRRPGNLNADGDLTILVLFLVNKIEVLTEQYAAVVAATFL